MRLRQISEFRGSVKQNGGLLRIAELKTEENSEQKVCQLCSLKPASSARCLTGVVSVRGPYAAGDNGGRKKKS